MPPAGGRLDLWRCSLCQAETSYPTRPTSTCSRWLAGAVSEFSEEEARAFISQRRWQDDQSYPDAPHQWTCRPFRAPEPDRTRAFEAFREMDRWIRRTFDSRTLYGYKGRVLDGYQYWSVFPVLNRTRWCDEHQGPTHLCADRH